jgi:hypothetical protein
VHVEIEDPMLIKRVFVANGPPPVLQRLADLACDLNRPEAGTPSIPTTETMETATAEEEPE